MDKAAEDRLLHVTMGYLLMDQIANEDLEADEAFNLNMAPMTLNNMFISHCVLMRYVYAGEVAADTRPAATLRTVIEVADTYKAQKPREYDRQVDLLIKM